LLLVDLLLAVLLLLDLRREPRIERSLIDVADRLDGKLGPQDVPGDSQFVRQMAAGEYKEIEEREGPDRAALFDAVANRAVTPLRTYYDKWIADYGFKPRTLQAHRQAFDMLERFLESDRRLLIIEAVTEQVASDFRQRALIRAGLASATGNKLLSSLRSYWSYLVENSHTASNPWRGKSIRKRRNESEVERRPFTNDEAIALLKDSRCPPRLLPFMLIAAYSAMRREEIMQLTVADVTGSNIRIRDSKRLRAFASFTNITGFNRSFLAWCVGKSPVII
jgi:integrase